ncbi:MAG: divalent-cation tolerance protein CutA, partial [Gammaproteobacteria bacterium]|nr:divalent-cation tolerance protein CutA [Gammaproteobacteria bacterium]
RLAACINIIANIGSIYWWKGEIHDTAECQLQIKTSHQSLSDTIDYIKQYHPNDIPEILVIPINEGNTKYFEWVKQETYDRE